MISNSDLDRYNDLRNFFKIKAEETSFNSISDSDLQIKIENFFNGLLPEMNDHVPPPIMPIQEVILNGSLEIRGGTISIANVPGENVLWQIPVADGIFDGTLSEMFVVGKNVYGIGIGGDCVFTPVNYTELWMSLPQAIYKDLRSTVTKIVVGEILPPIAQ
jgi:hypothetical protein